MGRVNDRTGKVEPSRPEGPCAPPSVPVAGQAAAGHPQAGGRFSRREVDGAAQQAALASLGGCDFAARYPTLIAWLTEGVWDDGTTRIPGTMVLFFESLRWGACLTDRGMNRKAFLTGKSVSELFYAIEEALAGDALSWRLDRGLGSGKRI